MLEDSANLWWDNITGPVAFVRALVNELTGARSVVLFVPGDIPWHEQMHRSVAQVLHENDPDLFIDYIDSKTADLTDDAGKINIPGFLLERYAYPEVKSGYRQSSGRSIQQYLMSKNVLSNRVIWITNATAEQVSAWISFCKGYRSKTRYDGSFVIEAHETTLPQPIRSGANILRYCDYVSYYDSLLFNNMICSAEKARMEWMQYKATVAALICNGDAELSKELIARTDLSTMSPVDALTALVSDPIYSQRYDKTPLDEMHPFSIVRAGDLSALQQAIWKGQLQVLFPLLESERIAFIGRYRCEIEEALITEYFDPKRQTSQYITQYGERVDSPYDVEIGTIYRMIHLRRTSDTSMYLLFLSREEDRKRIELLRNMRNSIAHVEPCPVEMIASFLSQYPYAW